MILGVSSCLLGNNCRYDGFGVKDDFVKSTLQKYFKLIPYCPENMIWGSPRTAIRQVTDENGTLKILTSTKEPKDVTKEIEDMSLSLAQSLEKDKLSGFILKSASPTCGIERVKVYKPFNAPSIKNGVGVFAAKIQELYPFLPIEEEGRLNDAWLRENFLMQVFAYSDLKKFLKTNPKMKEIVSFHTSYKYLIYAKSQASYKILGAIVANQKNKALEEILCEYESEFLKAIAIKSTLNKSYNILLHIFGYFKKLITKDEKEEILGILNDFKEKIVPLITVIKILNLYVKRFDVKYLKTQKFLNPYPNELALRSDIKAYK